MRASTYVRLGVMVAVTTACGGDSGPGGGSGGSGNQITGRERLAWDQQAPNQQELNGLRYLLWVDDTPDNMTGVTCEPLRSGVASCVGALRPMSPGEHRLALSAVGPDGS
ncbi:MAG: hypothetical protein FJW27_00225 [Acidimicrobiia bacterium]|nr:hypothetical protein [Acidimicrobiia bacterium]